MIHKSSMNREWKKSQLLVGIPMFLFSCTFWIMSAWVPSREMMPEQIYGEAVALFDAEDWAALCAFSGFAHVMGIYLNGRRWWSPMMRLLGCLGQLAFLLLFAYFARSAAVGDPLYIFLLTFLLPIYGYFAWLSVLDIHFTRRLHHGRV